MTRRRLLSTLIVLFAMTTTMLLTGAGNATAQLNCCHYTVDIQGIPNSCFPFRVATQWNCGAGAFTVIKSYGTNGVFIEPLGPPDFPPCPSPTPCRFLGASLDNANFVPPGQSRTFLIGNCCYVLSVTTDAQGCVRIVVRPCFN